MFGEILERMENLGEKIGERSFNGWLVGRESGKNVMELRLGVSMFDPTREHDMNPTRVFSG